MGWGLENVSVRFGPKVALSEVTVAVDASGITVVIGGDGAGKSTFLRTLVGLVRPDSGVACRPPKRAIGYVPATAGLYADLTVDENCEFSSTAYGLSGADCDRHKNELLRQVGLEDARDRLGKQLSGGMQRKAAVVIALLHSPELLVLDEPTTGVDPVSRSELWRLISGVAAQGTSVVLATTYVNEAARASSTVLLDAGKVLAAGSPEAILHAVTGAFGSVPGGTRPVPQSWRRGAGWRIWAPSGVLPEGATPLQPDFEDAVVVAELASSRTGGPR
jgi:ABC-2 type transport system ATP-binding protein